MTIANNDNIGLIHEALANSLAAFETLELETRIVGEGSDKVRQLVRNFRLVSEGANRMMAANMENPPLGNDTVDEETPLDYQTMDDFIKERIGVTELFAAKKAVVVLLGNIMFEKAEKRVVDQIDAIAQMYHGVDLGYDMPMTPAGRIFVRAIDSYRPEPPSIQ